MNANLRRVWEKVAEHPVPSVAAVVALVAAGALWYESDTGGRLEAKRDELKSRSERIAEDRRRARNLDTDIARAAGISRRIGDLALDFDSSAATAEFAARLARSDAVAVEGLPTVRGKIVPVAAKPYSIGEYGMVASGDFPTMLAFLTELANDASRSLVVSAVTLSADDNTPKSGRIKANITVRVWGSVKGRPAPVAAAPADKSVPSPDSRAKRMEAAEALLAPVRADLSSATNPFGESMSVAVVETPGASELDAALKHLDYAIRSIDGRPVVQLPGTLPKGPNGEFEVSAGGRSYRLRIVDIGTDDFTVVVLPSGKKIQVSPRQ